MFDERGVRWQLHRLQIPYPIKKKKQQNTKKTDHLSKESVTEIISLNVTSKKQRRDPSQRTELINFSPTSPETITESEYKTINKNTSMEPRS